MLVPVTNPPTSLAGRSVPTLRRRFPALFGAAAWPYLLVASIFIVINLVVHHGQPMGAAIDPVAMWHGMSPLAKLGVILSFVASASLPYGLAMAGVSLLAYEDYCGGETSLGGVLKRVMGRLLSLLALCFLVGCGSVFGSFLLFFPGLLVAMVTVFAVPVMLLEQVGVGTAIRRSMRLAWDRIGTVLVLLLIFFMAGMVIEVIFSLLVTAVNLEGLAAAMIMWAFLGLTLPILVCVYGTVLTILYHDIRVSRGELQSRTVMGST